jgi:hypothetical protein
LGGIGALFGGIGTLLGGIGALLGGIDVQGPEDPSVTYVLQGGFQTADSGRSQRRKRKMWISNLQRSDESRQPAAQVKGRVQTTGERTVDLSVVGEHVRAPITAVVLMVLETVRDFL